MAKPDAQIGSSRSAENKLLPEGRLTGPIPWVIAIMMFLTILAGAAGLSIRSAASAVNAQLAGQVTVQIVEANPDARDAQTIAVRDRLQADPNVRSITVLTDRQLEELLAPWLGREGFDANIPMPALIDVELKSAADAQNLAQLRQNLARVAPAARVDANSAWLRPVFDLLRSLQWLALALVLLLAFATAAAVLLSARSALNTNRDTIDVLHLLGGTDRQITRLFQRRIALDAVLGGALGLVLAALVIWLIATQASRLGSGFLDAGLLGPMDWIALALIPLAGVGLAILTARYTVLRALRKIL